MHFLLVASPLTPLVPRRTYFGCVGYLTEPEVLCFRGSFSGTLGDCCGKN